MSSRAIVHRCCNGGGASDRAKQRCCSEFRRQRPAARLRRFCPSHARPWTSTSNTSNENSAPKTAPPPPRSHGQRCATPTTFVCWISRNGELIELAQYPGRGVFGQVGNPLHEFFDAGAYHLATEILLQHFTKAARDTLAE